MAEARRLARLLNVHAELEHVQQYLHVTLRLHVAAHHAEAQPRLAVFVGHGRDDRVVGTLARRELVGMAFFEREQRAAVLEHHACTRYDHARAEVVEDRVDERDDVAVLVDDRQVDRVARAVRDAGFIAR